MTLGYRPRQTTGRGVERFNREADGIEGSPVRRDDGQQALDFGGSLGRGVRILEHIVCVVNHAGAHPVFDLVRAGYVRFVQLPGDQAQQGKDPFGFSPGAVFHARTEQVVVVMRPERRHEGDGAVGEGDLDCGLVGSGDGRVGRRDRAVGWRRGFSGGLGR